MERPQKKYDTGIVYYQMLQTAYNLEDKGADWKTIALYLRGCLEAILADGYVCDDWTSDLLIQQLIPVIDKARQRYNDRQAAAEDQKYADLRLADIASAVKAGKPQRQIARIFNISQSSVNRRIQLIRRQYPELLADNDLAADYPELEWNSDSPPESKSSL